MAHLKPHDGGAGNGEDALQRAIFALNNHRPQEAERIAGETLKRYPGNAQALHVLGSALMMQSRPADAIAVLEAAARAAPNPAIDTQLAVALRQADRPEDALTLLRRVIKRRPPYVPAFYELGTLQFQMKRYDEAIETLERGRNFAPMMPELSIQLGHALLALRDTAGAKAAFLRALDIVPNAIGALWGMGKAHQQIGENSEAIGYFRRSLMQMPNDLGTWLNLGHSLVETGDLDAGYECFRTAARADHKRYFAALTTLVKSGRGRFWLKPSDAAQFLRSKSD